MFQIRSEQFAAMRRKKIGDTLIERLAPFVTASWDAQGRQVLLRDASGARGALSFDRLGYLGGYTSPLGRTWQLTNLPDGKLSELTGPSGHVLSMAYTPEGLLAGFASTTQARISLFYDLRRYTASQYVDGTAETVSYTPLGDPRAFSDRLGHQVSCTYDSYRRLTNLTDGNGRSTHFLYDRWNRPETVLHPNGQREEFSYTGDGRLCRASSGADGFAEIESDERGRPLHLAYSDGLEARFSYSDAGLLTGAAGPAGGSSFQYDEHGQFVEEIAGPYKHTLAYDAGKRLSSITTLGATVQFRWDADSRLVGFTDWSGGEHLIEYLPGDRGHVLTGAALSGRPGVRTFVRTDTAGRLASLQVVAGGETRFSMACSYDTEGRLSTSADSAFGERAFAYDADSRLLYADAADARSREVFAYDAASNLAAVDATRFVYDAANQLMQAGKTVCRWDDRGNLLEASGPDGTRRFRYNLRNQLIASVADDGTETAYTYDALGRRTSKRTGDVETRFFWAGEQLLCEIRADLATGKLRRQDFLYHPETGAPLATAIDGEVYAIHTDHLGTPRALTAGTGEVVWLAELSTYGKARLVVNRVPMPLRFRGQYHDAETGLHYNRFRYYAPQWGRYTTRDPLTFQAGTNHYAYVDGNPLNVTDAYGLSFWKTVAVIGAAVAVGAVVVALAPVALPLAILAGAVAGGAVAGGLNEALNEKHLNLMCIARAAGLGALAGAAGVLPFLALPATAGLLAFAGAGALGGALSYGVNCLDGAEKSPSWGGLALSVGGGAVLGGLGKGIGDVFGGAPADEGGAAEAKVGATPWDDTVNWEGTPREITAEDANAEMVANGETPCWKPGTKVYEGNIAQGDRFNMVYSAEQASVNDQGGSWVGNFATPDEVPNQTFATNDMAIKVPDWKPDVSNVGTVETTDTQLVRVGEIGPVDDLEGGARQVQFANPESPYLPGVKSLQPVGLSTPLPLD